MALVGINRVRIKPSSHEHFFGLFWPFFFGLKFRSQKGPIPTSSLRPGVLGFLGQNRDHHQPRAVSHLVRTSHSETCLQTSYGQEMP